MIYDAINISSFVVVVVVDGSISIRFDGKKEIAKSGKIVSPQRVANHGKRPHF